MPSSALVSLSFVQDDKSNAKPTTTAPKKFIPDYIMTRYKGRASLKLIESKFPYHVDMMVPEGGFGSRLNAMHDWHDTHGIEAVRGQSRRENGRDIVRLLC